MKSIIEYDKSISREEMALIAIDEADEARHHFEATGDRSKFREWVENWGFLEKAFVGEAYEE